MAPSAKRTLQLLPYPIPNARPTKNMPTCRHARIPHLLQTKCAFPLLLPLHPSHHLRILEIIPRLLRFQYRRMRRPLYPPLTIVMPRRRRH